MALTLLASAIHAVAPYVPPGLVLSVAACFIVGGKYTTFWRNEFIGTLLMVSFTFSAGKWVGADSQNVAWLSHAIGVIAADYIGGGQHVNPAVSVSMWSLGKCDYTEMFVRIAGQMGGGLVAFPIFHLLSETLGWVPFGGPDFDKEADEEGVGAAFNELFATMLLLFLIYAVNWEINFGKYHYWIKQTLTALGIRYLIEMFPASGPAMNPMLGTTWAVFSADENVSAAILPLLILFFCDKCLCACTIAPEQMQQYRILTKALSSSQTNLIACKRSSLPRRRTTSSTGSVPASVLSWPAFCIRFTLEIPSLARLCPSDPLSPSRLQREAVLFLGTSLPRRRNRS